MLEPLCSRIIAKAGLRFAHLFSPFCSLGVKCFHGRPFSSQASMDPNLSCAQIRDTFVNYFIQRRDHKYVHSSSVIPHEDPTLLFANAGMNQVSEIRTHFHCPSSRCNVCVCVCACTALFIHARYRFMACVCMYAGVYLCYYECWWLCYHFLVCDAMHVWCMCAFTRDYGEV